jgi:predicted Fe-Mo cluster-binding NifX family protein
MPADTGIPTRIAFVTDDGQTISSHFGRAIYYEVITIDGSGGVARERRQKTGHHTAQHGEHHGNEHHHGAHGPMIEPILDCSHLVARGMGEGAHTHIRAAGITPILTDLHTINEALAAFTGGALTDNPNRLHQHGPSH